MRQISVAILMLGGLGLLALAVFVFVQESKLDAQQATIGAAIAAPKAQSAQAFILPTLSVNYRPIRDFNVAEPVLDARAAIVYDVNSNRVLYAYNSTEQLPIASITKLMTAVVIVEHMDLDAVYTVGAQDLNVAGLGTSLYRGEKIKGADLLKIMLINSDNDAASVFATSAQAQGIDLVDMMNDKARDLGMINTQFADPAGLDDFNTYSTAADLVKLVKHVGEFPIIWDTLITPYDEVTSVDGRLRHQLTNTNQLIGVIRGLIGGKTGNTAGALGTLAVVVNIQENTDDVIVGIVLGTRDRFGQMKKLITWSEQAHSWD